MPTFKKSIAITALLLSFSLLATAQSPDDGVKDKVNVHGSVQADVLIPDKTITIGSTEYTDKVMANVYADASIYSKYVDGGLRVEFLQFPLPGFEPDFKGWGVPNIYVKGKFKGVELTAGDFYEQFGSGFILRSYEERSLGIDNSIRGGRLAVKSIDGMRLTALGGVQRTYWDWSTRSQLYGANYEIDLQEFAKKLQESNTSLTLGASWVLKHEKDENIIVPGTNQRLNLPLNVNAFDARAHFQKSGWSVLAEYAWKGQDPSKENDYTYGTGSAYLLSASYSKSGLSAMVQAKRSENFAFRSRRSIEYMQAGYVNNLPPFSYQQTYTLAAMYPYATQMSPGEWAFQGSFSYKFKRKTPLGGKYGTTLKLNASWIRGLTGTQPEKYHDTYYGTNGLHTKFFGMGEGYYHDVNLQVEKKVTPWFSFNFMYLNQMYNQLVVEGHGAKAIHNNIFVFDGKFKLSPKVTLRTELQYLQSRDDHRDWLFGLAEVSLLPHLMFTVSDTWNVGGDQGHFYLVAVTADYKANRLMLGYGRTREGYTCAGGVCRYVPETRGVTLSYNYNF